MAILATARPTFKPAMRIIASITNAYPAVITTTFNHNYEAGMIVRIIIPQGFGMQEANQAYGPINVTGATTFTMDLDTSLMDPYATPASYPLNYQYGQVVPVGEINELIKYATYNVLPYSS